MEKARTLNEMARLGNTDCQEFIDQATRFVASLAWKKFSVADMMKYKELPV